MAIQTIQLGEQFKSPIGTKYQIIEIQYNKVKCLTLSGVFTGMMHTFSIEWVAKCMEGKSCHTEQ